MTTWANQVLAIALFASVIGSIKLSWRFPVVLKANLGAWLMISTDWPSEPVPSSMVFALLVMLLTWQL